MQGQNAAADPSGATAAPAASVIVERPPPGLARGRDAAPPWLIAALGALAVCLAIGFYVRMLRNKARP